MNSRLKSSILLLLLTLSLIFLTWFVQSFILPRVKAGTYPIIPSLVNLTPPYLRLTSSSSFSSDPRTHSLDVLASTAGQEVLAADLSLSYDPNILEIDLQNISLHDKFHVYSINKNLPGLLDLSLFSSPDRGEPTLTTSAVEESSLVTLNFKTKNSSATTTVVSLNFKPQSLGESNLIKAYTNRPQVPEDILNSVGSVTLNLK